MSGPQSFEELHQGLKKRKAKNRQRNVQIKDLKHRMESLESQLKAAQDEIRQLGNGREVWRQRSEMLDKERTNLAQKLERARGALEIIKAMVATPCKCYERAKQALEDLE